MAKIISLPPEVIHKVIKYVLGPVDSLTTVKITELTNFLQANDYLLEVTRGLSLKGMRAVEKSAVELAIMAATPEVKSKGEDGVWSESVAAEVAAG